MIEKVQNINKERWKINKIGLLNYWWYDEEELSFSDGRMILRGTNGSGKSVTMQSFIPLLLDGKRGAERLDPFGNRARKIEDYVLGYGDNIKDENTSYLYMEFVKEGTQNYKTVGIGLNGKKGQGVKFWGFIINDGRRVGKDIYLYKDISNKIPLTKLELKNRIGIGGEVVDTQKDYEKLVNNNIFGFETIEEFDEFIKLLIEIRTPKLSDGKGFRPSTVIEILTNSLRHLSDEDLRPVSESIDNMNRTKENLDYLKKTKKAVDKIKVYYDEYNKYLLYEKAKRYRDESKEFKEIKQEVENTENDVKIQKERVQQLSSQITEEESRLEAMKLKEKTLRDSEAWKIREQLSEMENTLIEINKNIDEKNIQIEAKQNNKLKKDNERKDALAKYQIILKEYNEQKEELAEDAKEISYDEFFFKMDEIERNLNQEFNFEPFYNDLQRYIDKIKIGKEALKNLCDAEKDYDNTALEIEKVKNNKTKQEVDVTKNRNARDDEKNKLEDEMYKWERENTIFKLQDFEKVKVAQQIERFGEDSSFDNITSEIRKPYENIRTKLLDEKLNIQREAEEVKQKIDSIKAELDEWKNKKNPEPENRLPHVIKSREILKEKGIEFLPFYQTVDFKSDITEETKGIIESALTEMSIIDSLVIKEDDLKNVLNIKEIEDKFLVPNPIEFRHDLTEFMQVSLPDNSKISPELIIKILKTVMIDEKAAQNYVDETGYYKIGLINGLSRKNVESKLIGQESRRKYRMKQIELLEKEIEDLNLIKEEIKEKERALNEKIEKLEIEFENFPSREELEEKQKELKISIIQLEAIKKELTEKEIVLSEKLEVLKKVRMEVEEKTAKMPFLIKLESYEEAFEIASDLKNKLKDLEKTQNNLVNKHQETNRLLEDLEIINEELDNLLYDLNKQTKKQKEILEKQNALKEMESKEDNNLQEQMDECLRLLSELPNKINKLSDERGRTTGKIEEQEKKLETEREKHLIAEKKMKISEDIFAQEVNLRYFKYDSDDLTEIMKDILKRYNNFEKQSKELAGYYADLVNCIIENKEFLADYSLTLEDLFITNIEEESADIIRLIKTRARKDITCFVKGRKVNFIILIEEINKTIEETQNLIDEDDRRLFEEILTNTVGRKIRESIYRAKDWVDSMNRLMETIDTSSKLSFSLTWKPKVATDETEMDTKELVDILRADAGVLRPEQLTKVANHFRSKFEKATRKVKEMDGVVSFHDIMKETLDYRMWYEFQFNYKKGNDTRKELTNNAFFKLSGGEKAMAMYIPLFAAVTSKFQSADENAPRIISLDEAFAGVDDTNIRDMFRILTELQLEYIINSQVLWGEYDTIPSLAINELISDPEEKIVTVIRYHWNGSKKELVL